MANPGVQLTVQSRGESHDLPLKVLYGKLMTRSELETGGFIIARKPVITPAPGTISMNACSHLDTQPSNSLAQVRRFPRFRAGMVPRRPPVRPGSALDVRQRPGSKLRPSPRMRQSPELAGFVIDRRVSHEHVHPQGGMRVSRLPGMRPSGEDKSLAVVAEARMPIYVISRLVATATIDTAYLEMVDPPRLQDTSPFPAAPRTRGIIIYPPTNKLTTRNPLHWV